MIFEWFCEKSGRVAQKATLLILIFFVTPACAQNVTNELLKKIGLYSFRSGNEGVVEKIQTDLARIGIYQGPISGRENIKLRSAILNFQKGLGSQTSGILTLVEKKTLSKRAAETRKSAGLKSKLQAWTGTRLLLPEKFVSEPVLWGDNKTHLSFESSGVSRLSIQLERYEFGSSQSVWLEELKKGSAKANRTIIAHGALNGFVYSVEIIPKSDKVTEKKRRYTLLYSKGNQTRSLQIELRESSISAMRPLIGDIISGFEPFAGRAIPIADIPRQITLGNTPERILPKILFNVSSTGSASIVSTQGHVLSNYHVVEGCDRLTAFGQEAILLGADLRSDLSILYVPSLAGRNPVRFSPENPNLGTTVFVLGYPLFPKSQSLNFTSGIVSSGSGFYGDRKHFQISAPVQRGNSGGPVLNLAGTQVGVVVSKPSAIGALIGNLENIAWVVRGSVAQDFLRRFDIPIITQSLNAPVVREQMRAREWKRITVRLECHDD